MPGKLSFILSLIISVALTASPANGQAPPAPELPIDIPDSQIVPLPGAFDSGLQALLVRELKSHKRWASLISREKMAVGLVDLTNPGKVKYARVNGDVMMFAASLPKLAILLAGCQSFEDSTLEETPEILQDMRIMISQSDNQAATRMIERLGCKKIEDILTGPRYKFYDAERGGGIWVGGRYTEGGRRYPEPLKGLSHAATVSQVCRFYYMLALGQLVSRERSRQMLGMMADSELHHKFVSTLDSLAVEAKLYRKSGTWRHWHSDSILVWGQDWRKYILVTLIEDPDGEQICRDLILAAEKVLKADLQLP